MPLPGVHARRAVCFLDILGFRNMLESRPLLEIAETYDRVIEGATGLNRHYAISPKESQLFRDHPLGEPYCTRYVFSDSIILVARDDDALSCLKLLVHAWRLVQATLAQRLAIRGAVACGQMYLDPVKGICLGHGLTAAYALEQRQDWIGVAFDESVEKAYPSLFPSNLEPNSIFESLFPRYPVPLKGGGVLEARTLNWRWNLVVEGGTRWLFPSTDDASGQEKIRKALSYADSIIKSGFVYAADQEKCPAELRAFWVGGGDPPFPHGDEL